MVFKKTHLSICTVLLSLYYTYVLMLLIFNEYRCIQRNGFFQIAAKLKLRVTNTAVYIITENTIEMLMYVLYAAEIKKNFYGMF